MTTDTSSSNISIKEDIAKTNLLIESCLKELLPEVTENPEILHESMRYSTFAGGKRIRPFLCLKTHELFDTINQEEAIIVASSLEMIHTYSLIHDDLPMMDNDDLRRGKPTNHKVYGDDIAILAGDALLTYAFEVISTKVTNASKAIKIIQTLSKAIGSVGMIGGQVLDVKGEGKAEPTAQDVEDIHTRKTGALLQASMVMGAICGNASSDDINRIASIGIKLGKTFQIVDDILDIESNAKVLGKSIQKDLQSKKITYPRVFGLEKSKALTKEITKQILEELQYFGNKANTLNALANYLASRSN